MITVGNERFTLKVYKLLPNSPYVWEDNPSIVFKGRPANNMEKKTYRIQAGVNGSSDSVFVICSNLPKDVKPKDKIYYLGREWTVQSIGYYYDASRLVNPGVFSDDYIIARCPKGLNLQ